MTIRKRVLYRGHVQGVGFRATCHHIAAGHAVAGWVKNLTDGGVELVAEGEPAALAAFLDAIAEELGHHVGETTEFDEPPRGERGFRIAR